MRNRKLVWVGLLISCGWPIAAHAQGGLPSEPGTLDAVAREIRLLREAFQRQGLATARTQLLIGQLTLQDQRSTRARATLERLEGRLEDLESERDRLRSVAREIARSLEQVTDDDQRQNVESEVRMIRTRFREVDAQVTRTQGLLSQARETLDIEMDRYDDLEARLGDLERQLQDGG